MSAGFFILPICEVTEIEFWLTPSVYAADWGWGGHRMSACIVFWRQDAEFQADLSFLHPEELNYYHSLKYERRMRSFLSGRYAAKTAIAGWGGEAQLREMHEMRIDQGIFQQPVALVQGASALEVSITHGDGAAAAIAFDRHVPSGIDLERVDPGKRAILAAQLTEREQAIVETLPGPELEALTVFWTAKEALSKALKTGLTVSMQLFEIQHAAVRNGGIVSCFEHFAQYEAASFVCAPYICSIVYPKRARLDHEAVSAWLCGAHRHAAITKGW